MGATAPLEHLAAPLQRERGLVVVGTRVVDDPQRPGVAGARTQRRGSARPDQQVGDVLEAADGLESIEHRADFAAHVPARGSMGPHRTANDVQRQVGNVEVGQWTDLANAVDLRRPAMHVVDGDEPDVEVDVRFLARPRRIKVREQLARQRQRCARADPLAVAGQHRVKRFTRCAGNVTVGQRVGVVAIGDEATDGGEVLLALHFAQDGVPASQHASRIQLPPDVIGQPLVQRGLDHAYRYALAVG